ncbi:MAG: DUF423 domain-containing protein [Planctomycetota bacterium]
MNRSTCILIGALLAGTGVALGALGAHGLEDSFAKPESPAWWETGVRYQVWHALALLALAGFATRPGRVVPLLLVVGTLGFSGSLYALALGASGSLWGPVTPIGGSLLLIGWLTLVARAVRGEFRAAPRVGEPS